MVVAVVQDSDTLKKLDGRREGGNGFICLPCFCNCGDLWVPWGSHGLPGRWEAASYICEFLITPCHSLLSSRQKTPFHGWQTSGLAVLCLFIKLHYDLTLPEWSRGCLSCLGLQVLMEWESPSEETCAVTPSCWVSADSPNTLPSARVHRKVLNPAAHPRRAHRWNAKLFWQLEQCTAPRPGRQVPRLGRQSQEEAAGEMGHECPL